MAGTLIGDTAAWLLDGLESIQDLTGLSSLQAGEVRMAPMPGVLSSICVLTHLVEGLLL